MEDLRRDGAVAKDIEVLSDFIGIYCENLHGDRDRNRIAGKGALGDYLNPLEAVLCEECGRLLRYAASRRIICPMDPKPSCKKCPSHCYKADCRRRIREVMRFSGLHMIRRGKIGLIRKYFF